MPLLPSTAECRELDTLGKIREWVGLEEDIFDLVDKAGGGFKDLAHNLSVLTADMIRSSLQSVEFRSSRALAACSRWNNFVWASFGEWPAR
eukprot:791472-Amphidinium_carterae.1